MIVRRFIDRLSLPQESKVIIKEIKKLNPIDKNQTYLELYHTIRSPHSETNSIVNSITKNGFLKSQNGNKGQGVYLASHSAYGLRWISYRPGMLICYVKTDEPYKINRFLAEIPPGYEYVVNPSIVIPAYYISYAVLGKNGNEGWRKLGANGCLECDKEMKRCDCSLEPKIYPEENIMKWKN
jgi:hypothetical protein